MSDLHLIDTLVSLGVSRDMAKKVAKRDKKSVRYVFCNLGDVYIPHDNPHKSNHRPSAFQPNNNKHPDYNLAMTELFARLGKNG